MTLPASGTIWVSQVNTETGGAANRSIGLAWIRDNTKPGQQTNNLGSVRGKAWYQRNVDGNCNNGNCSINNCNCGGQFQCRNCSLGPVNCANCDARAWLQVNCNCACTYNCGHVTNITWNCDCYCACDCSNN